MKAVISNRIYLDVNQDTKEKLREKLTYRIPRHRSDLPPEIIRSMRDIRPTVVSIPSGRTNMIPEGYEIIDKRINAQIEFPKFKFTLRPEQEVIFNQVNSSCRIKAPPSWGKTFVGIAIAAKLKVKTLIVTHNVSLRRQWEKEVVKTLGIQPGVVGSGIFNINSPVVVGNIQTVSNKWKELSKEFGLVMLDECHHCPASTFASVADTSHAKYIIGLSASDKRKDGRHVLFNDYFGDEVYEATRSNAMDPAVEIIPVPIRFIDGMGSWPEKVNHLCNNIDYIKYCAGIAKAYAERGHKVLAVGPRVGFLEKCAKLVGKRSICVTSKVSNETRDNLEGLIESGRLEIIFGTQSIFSEGISIPPLSVILLLGPINNDPLLEQLIGRIERIYPNKLQPIVADVHLIGKTVQNQASARMNYYISKGYPISYIR